jgi:1,4-dihydroxy-2-naphthoate octaprenyltransferase
MAAEAMLATSRPDRARAYLRLAKLDIIDYYLALPVAWSLMVPTARTTPRILLVLGLFLLGEVFVIASAVAFDDVTGFRDGSDAMNYGSDAQRRRLARKPLVSGALGADEAVRFALLTAAVGTLLWGTAAALAPFHPAWVLATALVCLLTAVQYSWGLKISYHGWQELFLMGFGVGMVLVPYGLATGRITAFAALQAVLFGCGPMLFGLYSNTNDAEGDAQVGRRTVAALLTPRGNAVFIVAMSLAQTALIAVAPVVFAAPWWFPLALLPVAAVRAAELSVFLRDADVLRARRLGIRNHRLTVFLLLAVNLLTPLLAGSITGRLS